MLDFDKIYSNVWQDHLFLICNDQLWLHLRETHLILKNVFGATKIIYPNQKCKVFDCFLLW